MIHYSGLKPNETGSGTRSEVQENWMRDIANKMNGLFSDELNEAIFIAYLMTMEIKLLENEQLAEQAANNSEEQFSLGDFKDIFSNTVIVGMEAHNSIAKQLLLDERIFAAMQGVMATAVYKEFKGRRPLP